LQTAGRVASVFFATVELFMKKNSPMNIKYSPVLYLPFFISAIASFVWCKTLHKYAQDYLLCGIENGFIIVAIKLMLFMSYLVPLYIGTILMRSKIDILQFLGMLLVGFGFGIVLRITLVFAGALIPY